MPGIAERPYPITPDRYKQIRDNLRTGQRIGAYAGDIWPARVPRRFRELVAKTTPEERLTGLITGEWPFSYQDITTRTMAELKALRVQRQADLDFSEDTDDEEFRNRKVGWRFNIEEFVATDKEVAAHHDRIFYIPH